MLKRLFAPTVKHQVDDSLYDEIVKLKEQIAFLDEKVGELSNHFYKLESDVNSKITSIHPVEYHIHAKPITETKGLKDFTLGV